MTTPQYLTHYEDNRVQEFLDELFERHTVLFVGYGLEEWEILERILRKGQLKPSDRCDVVLLGSGSRLGWLDIQNLEGE